MSNDETRSAAPTAGDAGVSTRRARYERPVLTHLGSVNRLTLSVTQGRITDGSLPSGKNMPG
jgi:hypothetical protein